MPHSWIHPAPHRYLCRHCGLEKRNLAELQPGGSSVWRVEFWQGADLVATGKTPPCPGQPVPKLTWERASIYVWDATSGHRICATRNNGRLLYSAWGPDRSNGEKYWPGTGSAHYARGAAFPSRREWLGSFPNAVLARQACAKDAFSKNSNGD